MSKKLKHGRIKVVPFSNGLAIASLKCETDFLARSEKMLHALLAICGELSGDYDPAKAEHWTACLAEDSREQIERGKCLFIPYEDGYITNYYLHHDNRKLGVVTITDQGKDTDAQRL